MVTVRRALLVALLAVAAALAAAAPAALAGGSNPSGGAGIPSGTPTAVVGIHNSTVGALFPRGSTRFHMCTASVIRSPHHNVVLTAAHCIRGSAAGYMVAPGFRHGQAPYGRWRVMRAFLDPRWISHQDPRRDFAFLVVASRRIHGHRVNIEQVTGGNRLGTVASRGQRVTVSAYPAGTDNDDVSCTSSVYFDSVFPAFDCNPYVDGTSGAPWLARLRRGPTVVGLIGGLHQGGCYSYTSYSPPFGRYVGSVFHRAVVKSRGDTAPRAHGNGCHNAGTAFSADPRAGY